MPDGTTAEVRQEPAVSRREADGGGSRKQQTEQRRPRRSSRKLIRYSLFALGAVVLVVGGLWYWLSGGRYVESDDAYVQGNVLTVSTDVSGIVDLIPVKDGEHVRAGQVLFRLDPLKFQLAVDEAQANLGQTKLNLESLKAEYVTGAEAGRGAGGGGSGGPGHVRSVCRAGERARNNASAV